MQPTDWNDKSYLHKDGGFPRLKKHYASFRIVTTDEEVAKWRGSDTCRWYSSSSKRFDELHNIIQDVWRERYAKYLTTLPELTDEETKPLIDIMDVMKKRMEEPVKNTYKFPYKAAVIGRDQAIEFITKEHTIVGFEAVDFEDLQYVCQAIKEKIQRDGKNI